MLPDRPDNWLTRNWSLLGVLERAILERVAFWLRISLGICGALIMGVESHKIELSPNAVFWAGAAVLILPGILDEIAKWIKRKSDEQRKREVHKALHTPSPDQQRANAETQPQRRMMPRRDDIPPEVQP